MSGTTTALDVAEVREGLAAQDPDRRLVPLDLVRVDLAPGCHLRVADAVRDVLPPGARGPVVLLGDPVLVTHAGGDLKLAVRQELEGAFDLQAVVLDDGHPRLHAADEVLDAAARGVEGAACVVSVGGGTVTDVAKVACERQGGLPLVVVQTAASVDGFTDNVSVVLVNGVKRTIPSQWPTTVLADPVTIGEAPARLNAAGFGEVLSMFTAPADWYLAHLVGLDPSFHAAPRDLLASVGQDLASWSSGVPARDPAAIATLTRLLAVRGMATGVSGTTAILSGVEHLVSHMLDLWHDAHDVEIGLHGEQVGVASPVGAAVWRVLRDRLAAGLPAPVLPDPDVARARVAEVFDRVDPSGATTAECWAAYAAKLRRCGEHLDRIGAVVAGWAEHDAAVGGLVAEPDALLAALHDAKVPATFGGLQPSVDDDLARWAVSGCLYMRDRFTAIDLLALCGGWDDETVDAVLAPSLRTR